MELVEDTEKNDEITTPTDPNVGLTICKSLSAFANTQVLENFIPCVYELVSIQDERPFWGKIKFMKINFCYLSYPTGKTWMIVQL